MQRAPSHTAVTSENLDVRRLRRSPLLSYLGCSYSRLTYFDIKGVPFVHFSRYHWRMFAADYIARRQPKFVYQLEGCIKRLTMAI